MTGSQLSVLFSFALVLTSLFANGMMKDAYACSCIVPDSPRKEMEKFDAVFSGKIAKIEERHHSAPMYSSADPVIVTFDVDAVWKGPQDKTITIHTAQSSASCGYEFEDNQTYIVYATENDNRLYVSLCSRTSLIEDASQDILELGPRFAVGSTSPEEPKTIVYPYGRGILEFSETGNQYCNISTPQVVTIDPKKDKLLNIDGKDNRLFIIIGNQNDDTYSYIEAELPKNDNGFPAYLLDMKNQNDEKIRGEFIVDYDQLAVVLIADKTVNDVKEDVYKKYLEGKSLNVSPSTRSLIPGNYTLDAILFMSDSYSWVREKQCVARVNWHVTITNDGKLVAKNPQVNTGNLKDITGRYSPLEQSKTVNFESIKCKQGLELVKKTDGSPACVRPESISKLTERGWIGKAELDHLVYTLQAQDKTFNIEYYITNGAIYRMVNDEASNSLIITLGDNGKEGRLIITIPRNLMDAKIGDPNKKDSADDRFFVLANGEEVTYTETSTEIDRTLTIEFGKNTKTIEIIGTNLILSN